VFLTGVVCLWDKFHKQLVAFCSSSATFKPVFNVMWRLSVMSELRRCLTVREDVPGALRGQCVVPLPIKLTKQCKGQWKSDYM
jgi:hypothetical protein